MKRPLTPAKLKTLPVKAFKTPEAFETWPEKIFYDEWFLVVSKFDCPYLWCCLLHYQTYLLVLETVAYRVFQDLDVYIFQRLELDTIATHARLAELFTICVC